MSSFQGCLVSLLVIFLVAVVAQCPNGCSSRGLCINNQCVCAEGLTGSDCSIGVRSNLPSLYDCPSCYALTVGPARYYSGPSWRIPDGPIVALNYKGKLMMYQGNGNGELVAEGTELDDWLQSPIETLSGGSPGQFDSCGSWIMRALTLDGGDVAGFYHAETACEYQNNGQTRKSAALSISKNGGRTFTKPGYPSNRLVDTNTSIVVGLPTGEGDFSVVLRDNYFYLFFANVETYFTGVARSPRGADAWPGSFRKYFNGQWNNPGVGGASSRLNNMPGPQVYLHTPSQNFVAVGNVNPYWNQGFMMSASDNAIDWKYVGDPITTPDPITNNDQFMYPSFMGPTGGSDIGSKFQYFYMWIAPGSTWTYRYQIVKDITLSYVGYNSTAPATKMALTTFRSSVTGETWQSTEIALPPYKASNIVGYLMTRAYSHTFVVYDCYNFTTGDHFVGTADECFLSGAGVETTRVLGYMYTIRQPQTVAVYRCYDNKDIFLSADSNCEGRASAQTVVFGYMLTGPALSNTGAGFDVLVPQGSNWLFYNKTTAPPSNWIQRNFDDSTWNLGLAPFGASYSKDLVKTPFGPRDHYFRTTFTIPAGSTVKKMLLAIASDNYAIVYINGVQVDRDPASWHEAAFWNRRVFIPTNMLNAGNNTITVQVVNNDNWAFFDLELSAKYNDQPVAADLVCSPACGTNSQCIAGKCVCDIGWAGLDCNTNLCSYTDTSTQMVIQSGSSYRHTAWRNTGSTPPGWFAPTFDDGWWHLDSAPFGTTYYWNSNVATWIGGDRHLYRKKFLIEVPFGKSIVAANLSLMTDDTQRVYINGKFVGSPVVPYNGHNAKRWNDLIEISGSVLNEGVNVIAVEVPLYDGRWTAFFDMQLQVAFALRTCTPPPASPSTPTTAPTTAPTLAPTPKPTLAPTSAPTPAPTPKATPPPTAAPTPAPTPKATPPPTAAPTPAPTPKATPPPTAAPTSAPTTKPTSPPTAAPTPVPTPKATTAPTAPTSAPTTAPTAAPTTRPTAAATSAPANTAKLNVYQGTSSWWFACFATGGRSTEVTKMEIKDSGALRTFSPMTKSWSDVYTFNAPGTAFVLPVQVKASLASGASVTFTVTSFNPGVIDSGTGYN